MKLVLLGAPGAGKGTQAEILREKLRVPAISTGNMLREAVRNGTLVDQRAKTLMDAGELVPDDVIIEIVQARLSNDDCKRGYIFDGIPRTVTQAIMLEEHEIGVDVVLSIEISDEEIEKRMVGRRSCPTCGAVYHVEFNPPKSEGVCDVCGKALIIRKDDEPQTVRNRLRNYHRATEPLKEFYKERGKLKTVDNIPGVEETTAVILKALGI